MPGDLKIPFAFCSLDPQCALIVRYFLFTTILLTLTFLHADEARIPLGTELITQQLSLEIDPGKDSYRGKATLLFELSTETNAVYFHADQLTLEKAVLSMGDRALAITLSSNAFHRVRAEANNTLTPGSYALTIDFSAKYGRRGTGIYKVDREGTPMVFTQMEPEFARSAFPCLDEPSFKAPWEVQLIVPDHCLALANAPVQTQTNTDGLSTIQFAPTPPMPSYLMAIAVGPFETVNVPGLEFDARIICPPGQTNLSRQAAAVTPALVKSLETYFASPYPYKKLDQIAVPEFNFGAMENPGLVTYRDTILLIDTDAAAVQKTKGQIKTIAHELAHMWFGNLVTPEWWNDLWLNESFASWMAQKIAEEVHPELKFNDQDIASRERAMGADSLPSAYAIRREVDGAYDKTTLFDSLSYSKGMAILNMLEYWVGEETFRNSMQSYMKKFAWENADAFDLAQALEQSETGDITPIMKAFTTQPGIPLVHFKKISDNQIKIEQAPYQLLSDTNEHRSTWPVPVMIELFNGSKHYHQRILLGKKPVYVNLELPLSLTRTGYFYPNANEKAYYRWTLEGFPPVNFEQLGLRERLGFLHNLRAQLDAGVIDPTDYLDQLKVCAPERDPALLITLTHMLTSVSLDLIDDTTRPGFATFVESLLIPALDDMGWDARENEDAQTPQARASLISTLGFLSKNIGILERARQKVAILQHSPDALDPNLLPVWLKLAPIRGDHALFQMYQQQFETVEDPNLRQYYLAGIGQFTNSTTALEALAYSLSDAVTPQEWARIAFSISEQSPANREMVFNWYCSYYNSVKQKVPRHYMNWHVWLAVARDTALLERGHTFFFEEGRKTQGIEIEFKKAQEVVRQRRALYQPHKKALQKYFSP